MMKDPGYTFANTCTHAHMHACTEAHMHVLTRTYMHAHHAHTHTHACTHTRMHTHTHTHTHTDTHRLTSSSLTEKTEAGEKKKKKHFKDKGALYTWATLTNMPRCQ